MKKLTLLILCFSTVATFAQSLQDNYSKPLDLETSSKEKKKPNSKRTTFDVIPNTENTKHTTNLLEKADYYFNKMWYTEAAELYEEALANKVTIKTAEILSRAGDAYYFNSNMERAYYWYDQLYETYKKEVSSDYLFKYAHTLKGTGKYGRAKRLMRLYNRKAVLENSTIDEDDASIAISPEEIALDNILESEAIFSIKNLNVNSKYSDFAPQYYNTDDVVFASAKDTSYLSTNTYKWNNQPYLDLYVAKINEEDAELKDAVKFSKKINTKYHEASVVFSADNTTMYFTRNNYKRKLKRDENGINNLKIYRSVKKNNKWSEAEELPFNSDDYSTGHPALSPDGTKLYFTSDMPGTIGETDIFVVTINEDGSFSAPMNLGPKVNTPQREMFPFISEDKMYFSSDGYVGLGGLDIFEVTLAEDGYSEVVNVGKPVNSNKDDFSFIIDKERKTGYFSSNRDGGKGDDDIYAFTNLLLEEVNENAISGVVIEELTGVTIPKAMVTLLDNNNRKIKEMESAEDGSFVFEDLEGNTKYVIHTEKETFFDDETLVETEDNTMVATTIKMRKLEDLIRIEDGIKKLKTEMIYFDFDKSYIRTDASNELDKVVEVMHAYPKMVIKIESHTDVRGNNAYNKLLSDRRAKSTRDYLVASGIDADRIESAIGYGEERLINECGDGVRCSAEKHELNRRSEIIIVKM